MTSHRLAAPPRGPHSAEDLGHSTHAAMWTGCAIAFVGACVGVLAALGLSNVFWFLCVGIVLLALAVYAVMNRMGMGQYSNKEIDSAEDSPTVGIS